MKKMFAVLKREYIQAVRRKAFIIMTLIFPFLMGGMMVLPSFMIARGIGEKHIAVLDGTGKLENTFSRTAQQQQQKLDTAKDKLRGRRRGELPSQFHVDYVSNPNADKPEVMQPYLDRISAAKNDANRLDGVFIIPAAAMQSADTKLTYFSRSATDFITQERLARLTNKSIQRLRLEASGVNGEKVDELLRDAPVEAVQLSRTGEKKTGGELNFLLGFLMAAMLITPSLVYGTETMRGIVQEKSDRVVEVLVSSVTPMQLLTGKITGIAAVGLTQLFVWVVMMGTIGGAYGTAAAAAANINFAQFFRPIIFVYFFIFFVLAYLTYVCIYAIAGAVCNTEREAQQFIMPVMLLMLLPWILAMPIITNPDSPLATGLSLSPGFGPITMFMRTLGTDPPAWHIITSIVVSILTILAFFWATGKIFRIGILSYGKRPTLPELWQWLKVA